MMQKYKESLHYENKDNAQRSGKLFNMHFKTACGKAEPRGMSKVRAWSIQLLSSTAYCIQLG